MEEKNNLNDGDLMEIFETEQVNVTAEEKSKPVVAAKKKSGKGKVVLGAVLAVALAGNAALSIVTLNKLSDNNKKTEKVVQYIDESNAYSDKNPGISVMKSDGTSYDKTGNMNADGADLAGDGTDNMDAQNGGADTLNTPLAGENDVCIAGAYIIKSTEKISDAYKSGDRSGLTDKEKETLDMAEKVIKEVIPPELLSGDTKYFINPTGRFEIGGPHGDSGLTGRKIIVDTYGGSCPHGGGAFSGKDPTKVDRSAAYMARYICKNVVAAGLASECTLEVAYAIGVAKPVSLFVNTKGTGKLPDGKIADIISKEFDLRPASIIKTLDLRRPIYKATAAYGHFGRPEFPWEKLDRVDDLKKYL